MWLIASPGLLKLVDELTSCDHGNSLGHDRSPSAKCNLTGVDSEVEATIPTELPCSLNPSIVGNNLRSDTFQESFSSPLDVYEGNDTLCSQRPLQTIYNIQEQLVFSSELREDTSRANLEPSLNKTSTASPFNLYDQHCTIERRPPPADPRLGLPFLPLAADEEKWDVSNDAFLRALQSTVFIPTPDRLEPDVPFKAIFGGWHTVDEREREKPIWNMLRLIDERVFGMWTSKVQKVALMYVTHALVKVCSSGNPG